MFENRQQQKRRECKSRSLQTIAQYVAIRRVSVRAPPSSLRWCSSDDDDECRYYMAAPRLQQRTHSNGSRNYDEQLRWPSLVRSAAKLVGAQHKREREKREVCPPPFESLFLANFRSKTERKIMMNRTKSPKATKRFSSFTRRFLCCPICVKWWRSARSLLAPLILKNIRQEKRSSEQERVQVAHNQESWNEMKDLWLLERRRARDEQY